MKNPIFILSLLVIVSGTIFTKCHSSSKKENKDSDTALGTENFVVDTLSDSVKMQQDTTTSYQKFIIESERRINIYENNIADLKIIIAKEKNAEKAVYEKRLAQLEQKNEAMKTKIIEYKDKQIDDWDKKQIEFRKDLDDLGNAIADFFVKDI